MTLILLGILATICISYTIKVYKKYWDYGLTAKVSFSQTEVEEGQSLTLIEKVENRKALPLPTLMVKFEVDRGVQCVDKQNSSLTDKQYRNDSIVIMANERVTRSIEVVGKARGFYSIDEISLVATDILFRSILSRTDKNYTWLYVYPSRSKFIQLPQVFSRLYGECLETRLFQEDSMEFKGIRDYAQTDPMHRINWKASARTGSLKVNQYYDSSSQRFTIFLNVTQSGILKYYDVIEESVRIARNFIENFVGKGIPVRIISNGVDKLTRQEIYIREGAGLSHIDACLKQLAKMDIYTPSRGMEEVIREWSSKESRAAYNGEISLLISAEQTAVIEEAYLEYVSEKGSANWLIPIHKSAKRELEKYIGNEKMRKADNHYIHVEYLVMEELEG